MTTPGDQSPTLAERLRAEAYAYSPHSDTSKILLKAADDVEQCWRCFHCGEVFTDRDAAADHFGVQIDGCADDVACKLNATEGLLVKMLREAQEELRRYRQEDNAAFTTYYALGADHATALRREEEKGYARGLKDFTAVEAERDRLTLALAASEAEKETYRARWLSCVTPEEAERLRQALAVAEAERNEAYRQNPILREQVRELQESLAVLDEAYRAVTEQLSRSATLAATAEVERDSLREQLANYLGYTVILTETQEGDAARKRSEEVTEES